MALTWREVSAPDFRGVQTGISNATQMLQNAASGWNNMLTDSTRRAGLEQQLMEDQYQFGRVQTGNAAVDAATPALRALTLAAQSNDPIAREAAVRDPALANLPIDRFNAAVSGAQTATGAALTNDGRALANTAAQTLQDRSKEEFEDTRTAQAMAQDIRWRIPGDDIAGITKAVGDARGSMSPGAWAKLMSAFPNAASTLVTPVGTMPGADVVPGSTGARTATVAPAAAIASAANPNMDRFINGLAKLETAGGTKTIKGPKGEDSNNLFNIKDFSGGGFRAVDKAEGSNDAYRTYASPEESKADLMNLLSRKYPAALSAKTPAEFAKALKDGGYATDPKYVEKLTQVIDGLPVGSATASTAAAPSTGPVGRAQTQIAMQGLQQAASQQTNPLAANLISARDRDIKGVFPDEVISELRGKDGPLSGVSTEDVRSALNYVMKEAKVGPAVAGIVVRSAGGGQNLWQDIRGTFGFDSKDTRINKDALNEGIRSLANAGSDSQLIQARNTTELNASVGAAREKQVAAANRLAQLEETAKVRPIDPGSLARAKEAYDLSVTNLRELEQSTRSPNVSPTNVGLERAAQLRFEQERAAKQAQLEQSAVPAAVVTQEPVKGVNRLETIARGSRSERVENARAVVAERESKAKASAMITAEAALSANDAERAYQLMNSSGFNALPRDTKARIHALVNGY